MPKTLDAIGLKNQATACADRRQRLEQANLIVVKIGSAVIADQTGLDRDIIASLASQLALIRATRPERRLVLVSSGAVAAGRGILAAHGRPELDTAKTVKQALAAIGQGSLMRAWTGAFNDHGLITAQALLTRDDFHSRERFQHAADTFAAMLAWGVIPIVNENDTVAVHELQFGDNDTLASLLINLVEADLFINLTSAPGVKAANPEVCPGAEVLPSIANIRSLDLDELCGAKTPLGSGGMRSKLLAARRIAQLGVPTLILPGRLPDALLKAFGMAGCASPLGTWVCPERNPIPRRKFWLAYQSDPRGLVVVDDGAAEALLHQGKSLLPGGICEVRGEFDAGALISISHKGNILGVGFCNYASDALRRIAGRKRHEIAAILGNPRYPDAVHRDNMLLDAAV